jgi:hypothetical protein
MLTAQEPISTSCNAGRRTRIGPRSCSGEYRRPPWPRISAEAAGPAHIHRAAHPLRKLGALRAVAGEHLQDMPRPVQELVPLHVHGNWEPKGRCRFSTCSANTKPLTSASSGLLTDLASDLSHRSGQFFKSRTVNLHNTAMTTLPLACPCCELRHYLMSHGVTSRVVPRSWHANQSRTAAFGDWAWPGAVPGDQLQDLRHWLVAYAGTRLEAWSGWPR